MKLVRLLVLVDLRLGPQVGPADPQRPERRAADQHMAHRRHVDDKAEQRDDTVRFLRREICSEVGGNSSLMTNMFAGWTLGQLCVWRLL